MSNNKEDSKKYFDKKNYSTIILNDDKELSEKKSTGKANIIDLLTSENNKEIKEDVLKVLKQKGGAETLIDTVSKLKSHPKKHLLVAAFWEANIECNNYLDFFVDLALNENYEVCLEAVTVIQEMTGTFKYELLLKNIDKTKNWLSKNKNDGKVILIENMLDTLTQFSNHPTA